MSGNREALLSNAFITIVLRHQLSKKALLESEIFLFYESLGCLSVQDNGLEFSNHEHNGFKETAFSPRMFTVR